MGKTILLIYKLKESKHLHLHDELGSSPIVFRDPFCVCLEILVECLSFGEFLPLRLAGSCGTVRLGSEAGRGFDSRLNGTYKNVNIGH